MHDAHVSISVDDPGAHVTVAGALSAATVADVRSTLVAVAEHGSGDLVLDISGVDTIDASGLGVLVGAHRLAERRERRLVLCNVPERVGRLLAATRLNRILAVEPAVG
ncbi:MAG TPA: STAS domain-containing protein [Mycobacteriales bacterium]|nr:STAS domain-containing protein [Mycobacteriales bacterium]